MKLLVYVKSNLSPPKGKIEINNATKNATSYREYELEEYQVSILKDIKDRQKQNKLLLGNSYHEHNLFFACENGNPIYPDYVTKAFKKIIRSHPELPQQITLHGLRKSCVSILVHEGFDVKSFQDWVGHKDVETTLKIYAQVKSKEE